MMPVTYLGNVEIAPQQPLDPLIRELLRKPPPPGSQWPAAERVTWLRALAAACDVVYGPAEMRIEEGGITAQ
jgi:hypothetical protein